MYVNPSSLLTELSKRIFVISGFPWCACGMISKYVSSSTSVALRYRKNRLTLTDQCCANMINACANATEANLITATKSGNHHAGNVGGISYVTVWFTDDRSSPNNPFLNTDEADASPDGSSAPFFTSFSSSSSKPPNPSSSVAHSSFTSNFCFVIIPSSPPPNPLFFVTNFPSTNSVGSYP